MTTSTSEHTITRADVEGKDVLHDLYADWSQIMATTPDLTIRLLRSVFDEWHQPTVEPQGVTYREDTVGGVPGIWCLPEGADKSKVLLYTHGGGFAVGSASSHRKLAGHVAKALGAVSFVLDYRRAPEFAHPAQLEDGVAAFDALAASGIAREDITTIGDSAGGNLAIAIALALKEQGKPGPGSVIAFSPWLDMENKGETLVTNNDTDALITPELLEGMIAGVLGDTVDPKTPLANPLYADFTGFPRLYVTAGSVESLLDNATRLAERAQAAGVDVTLSIGEGQQHVYPFLAGRSATRRLKSSRSSPPGTATNPIHISPSVPLQKQEITNDTPHHPPDCRRRCHRRRIRRHLRRPQAAQRTRPHDGRFRQGRRPRRHLVLEPLPGRTVGHREPPLPLLLRPRPAAGQHVEVHLPHAARDSRVPGGVVDRFDLRRHFRFGTAVTSAIYSDDEGQWEVTTDDGAVYHATYVVNAVGLLSAINFPNLPGLDTFEGETIHTAAWPEGKDLTGRRVGVIGTGSTGQQVITALAPKVEQLTVFVRTPQYSVPVGNRPVTAQDIDAVKADYDQIWAQVKRSAVAFGFEESTVPAMSVSEEERRRIFEEAWQHGGGFRFMFATFGDIATDEDANEAAASFIRSKIADIIEDPETARKLMPTGLFAKRPLCDDGYHRVFNRPNVEAVAIKENPIREVTAKGVVTEDGILHELDVLVFATGFDAVDGNYRRIEIRGRDGLHINDHWGGQPTSYLGVATANFPNWFMVLGPNGPFTNLPPSIETQVEWISDTIDFAERNGVQSIEPTPEAEAEWTDTCTQVANATLFTKGNSWIFGANVPGKKPSVLFYLGGLGNYRAVLADVTADGFRGFEVKSADMVAA